MSDAESAVRVLSRIQQELEVHNYLTKRLLFLTARQTIPLEDIEAWETGIDTRIRQILRGANDDRS